MPGAATLAHALPHPLPDDANARLALFAIRRLGAHGLSDAHAVHAFMTRFDEGFRRPLVLMRAFMQENSPRPQRSRSPSRLAAAHA